MKQYTYQRQKKLLIFLIIVGCVPFMTHANTPIGGAMAMAFPLVSALVSTGIALFLTILVEMFSLRKRLAVSYKQAFLSCLYANIISTAFGILVVVTYSSSEMFMFGGIIALLILLQYVYTIGAYYAWNPFITKYQYVCLPLYVLAWFAVGMIGSVAGSALTPAMYKYFSREGQLTSQSFIDLQQRGVSEEILQRLRVLENRPPLPRATFFAALRHHTGNTLSRQEQSLIWESAIKRYATIPSPPPLMIQQIAFALLLGIGFLLTIIIEGAIIIRRLPEQEAHIFSTVILMNLVSYSVLFMCWGDAVWERLIMR